MTLQLTPFENFIFFFISVHFNGYLVITDLQLSWDVTVHAAVYSPVECRAGIGWWGGAQVEGAGLSFLHLVRTGNAHFFRSIFWKWRLFASFFWTAVTCAFFPLPNLQWAKAMNLSRYCRALIFWEENKDLIVIGAFYFKGYATSH